MGRTHGYARSSTHVRTWTGSRVCREPHFCASTRYRWWFALNGARRCLFLRFLSQTGSRARVSFSRLETGRSRDESVGRKSNVLSQLCAHDSLWSPLGLRDFRRRAIFQGEITGTSDAGRSLESSGLSSAALLIHRASRAT